MANKLLILLGHQSYQGANARRLCFSKAQAIRVLRNRGCTRDQARAQLNREFNQCTRRGYIALDAFNSVEVSVYVDAIPYGWLTTYEEMRVTWSNRAEA